jgi:hypothetical protein
LESHSIRAYEKWKIRMSPYRNSMSHHARVGMIFVVLATASTWAGCGGDGIERVELSGKVTYRGQPVEEGFISLEPIGQGIQSGAKIIQGAYEAVGRGSVPVGKYKVRISWLKDDKSQQMSGFSFPVTVNVLPFKYNKTSQLTLEVPSGEGSMIQDYILD